MLLVEAPWPAERLSAWVSLPVAEPGTESLIADWSARMRALELPAASNGWKHRYDTTTGCIEWRVSTPATKSGTTELAKLVDAQIVTLAKHGGRPPLALVEGPKEQLAVLPSMLVRSSGHSLSGEPFHAVGQADPIMAGSMRRVAPPMGDPRRPALLIAGAAYDSADGAAFLLLAARLATAGFMEGMEVVAEQRAGLQWLRVRPIDAIADGPEAARAWSQRALSRLSRLAMPRIAPSELDMLRQKLALDRARQFEEPFARLAFLARRLRFAPLEAVLAEPDAMMLVTPGQMRRVAQRTFADAHWQLVLPGETSSPIPAADSDVKRPYLVQTLGEGTPRVVVEPVAQSSPSRAICLMVGLPGAPVSGFYVPFSLFSMLKEPRPIPFDTPTREQAALLWWARTAQAAARYPSLAARVRVTLPSLLPGVLDDPSGSNQFTAIILESDVANERALHDFARLILATAAERTKLEAVEAELARRLEPETHAEYNAVMAQSAALLGGTAAGEGLELRRKAMSTLARDGRMNSWRKYQAAEYLLFAPGNLIVAAQVASDASDETIALRLSNLAGAVARWEPSRSDGGSIAPWTRPEPRLTATVRRDIEMAHLALGVEAAPEAAAALLLLNQMAQRHLQDRLPGRGAASAILTFPQGSLWYLRCLGNTDTASLLDRMLETWLDDLLDDTPGEFAERLRLARSEAQQGRHDTRARTGERLLQTASDALLFGEPARRQSVDEAIARIDATALRSFVELLRQQLGQLLPPPASAP